MKIVSKLSHASTMDLRQEMKMKQGHRWEVALLSAIAGTGWGCREKSPPVLDSVRVEEVASNEKSSAQLATLVRFEVSGLTSENADWLRDFLSRDPARKVEEMDWKEGVLDVRFDPTQYSLDQLKAVLRANGLEVEKSEYLPADPTRSG
ncbi:hypothetical protein HNR46_002482 [Haloferula luteola]|uniref:HMA domain-containing protein n=1 Tax=Haloferula luteola TaxID=595692 RepID=A0A840VEI1_9BACT|nr:hypothetical protein [Haloferula luteola]MBB5352239.1 hypothetical protein [Haloferula luteola]